MYYKSDVNIYFIDNCFFKEFIWLGELGALEALTFSVCF